MIREDEGERDIDEIIDKAQPGDTIYLSDGIYCSYKPDFSIDKPLTLIAKNLPTLWFKFDVEKEDVKFYFHPYPSVKLEHHPPKGAEHRLDIIADYVSLIGLATPPIYTSLGHPNLKYAQHSQAILCDIVGADFYSYSKLIGCCLGALFLYGNKPYANFVFLKSTEAGYSFISIYGFTNAEVANVIGEGKSAGAVLPFAPYGSRIWNSTIRNSYLFWISGNVDCDYKNFWIKDSELGANYLIPPESPFYFLKEKNVTRDMKTVPVEQKYLYYTNENEGWVDIPMLLEELERKAWWKEHGWKVVIGSVGASIGVGIGIYETIKRTRK